MVNFIVVVLDVIFPWSFFAARLFYLAAKRCVCPLVASVGNAGSKQIFDPLLKNLIN